MLRVKNQRSVRDPIGRRGGKKRHSCIDSNFGGTGVKMEEKFAAKLREENTKND